MKSKIFIFTILILSTFIGCEKDTSVMQSMTEDKITAVYKYEEVNSFANPENKNNGLVLESIKSNNVDKNGASEKWSYGYSSAGIAVTYYYQATKNKVKLDSVSTVTKIPPIQLISNNWLDSKELIEITETNGGSDFRTKNKKYKIKIRLEEPLGYNAPTYWYVEYYSIIDSTVKLQFIVDASTGELKL